MMQIMLKQMPDDPLAREDLFLASVVVDISYCLLQIGKGPAVKRFIDHFPGCFKSTDQFRSGSGGLVGTVPLANWNELFAALFQHIIQPSGTHGHNMRRNHTNRAKILRCMASKLIR